ncbi:MAG: LysM domain [Actinomycetota bacterium]
MTQRPNMGLMFLRTRLHTYLVWSTGVFVFLAILSGLLTDGGGTSSSPTSTVEGQQESTTSGVPTTTGPPQIYIVQSGDTLYRIAERFNLSAPALVELNNIKNPDNVPAGTELMLPPSTGFVPIGATTTMPP